MDDAFAEEPPEADNRHDQHADESDAPQEGEGSLEERVVSVEVGPLWDHNHATKVAREYELAHPSRRWTGQWKTIVPRQMSVINIVISPDTARLQEAIQSGGMESVDDLLQGMTIPQRKAQLGAYYGGSKDVPGSPDNNDLYVRTSPMLHAARCGNSEAFSSLFSFTQELLKPQLKAKLKATDGIGRTVLAMAASSGKRGAFDAILAAVNNELDATEVGTLTRAKDKENRSLLAFAAESRDEDTFKAVQEYLERELTEEEEYDLIDPEEYLGNKLLLEAVKSYKGNDLGLLNAVLKDVGNYFRPDSSHGEMLEQNRELCGQALLCQAIRCCEIELFRRTPDFLDKHLADKKAAEEITIIVSDWANSFRSEHALFPMDEHAEKIEEFFKTLLRSNKLFDWVKTCLSGPLVCSKNPFVPGLTLSLAFSRAARSAPEGEGKKILSLQEAVNEFLLQVLARLPQSVRGCKGSISCFALFEPALPEGRPNPLQMMVGKRKERLIFCESSLVMDYLSRRFSRGLPDLLDTNGILGEKEVLGNLAKTNGGLLLDDIALEEPPVAFPGNHQMLLHLLHPLVLLQGADANFPSLAGLPIVGRCPGLQFITAGIVARPSQYYRVPVLRMALEFIVYVAMVTVFVFSIIIHSDGELKQAEIIFFVSFVASGIIREVREMIGDHETYFEDDWNALDVLSLVVLLAGFVVRSIDDTSPWGRALYALSAPLLFSRFLFFLQILQFQGPMIQVIIRMIRELIQFGVVMLVVMLGFVVAFFALFQDEETFSEMFLRLFRAMLGNDDLFDDFGDEIQDNVATALLIVYLIIMTIMFLNLLIAVLSTAYSKVEENAKTEYKVVKARVIQHYEMTVENEALPAPFNLVQLALSWLFILTGGSSRNAEKMFGQAVFWLVLGPIAVAVGVLMWILSVFHAPFSWTECYLSQSESRLTLFSCRRIAFMFIQWVIIIVWCGLLAPICLVMMWFGAPLWSGIRWLCGCCGRGQESPLSYETVGSTGFLPDVGVPGSFDINETLLNIGESARDLFTYLADPMSDPEVREGENNKLTTVEHLKLLRDRLEDAAKKHAEELRAVRREMKQREHETEQKLDEIMCILRKVGQTSSG